MDVSVATLLVVLLSIVEHITSTNTHDDRNPGLLFDNHPGYILSLPANMTKVKQMSTKVSSKMDCVFACVETPWCRSVNFKITAEMDGRHICEVIGTDNYTNPKHLKQDEKFAHLNIKNPCETKPCLNKGKCVPHKNRLDYRCRCKKGYNGEKCQHDINECASNPCANGGQCIDGVNSYRCNCAPGYRGVNCEEDINECASNPCVHGYCTDKVNGYTCTCNPGYTGPRCNNNINECASNPCQNGGNCADGVNDYTCTCQAGYTGQNCQTDVDECAAKPCDANAACRNTEGSYQCTCNGGYYGDGKQCTPYAFRGLANSAILHNNGNSNYLQRLSSYLDPVLQSSSRSRWVRCWRAASDGWNTASTFHPKCDGEGPTVTIVRVGSYVFGGYTDVSWHSGGHYNFSSRSFLYSLYNINGYSPVKLTLNGQYNQNAIYGNSDRGPSFGRGHDLYISNFASSNMHCCTNPYSYYAPTGCSHASHCSFFAGHFHFTPNDVEVFYETTS